MGDCHNFRFTCVVLFKAANLFLATKIALLAEPRLPSVDESLTSPLVCVGREDNSYKPLSEAIVVMTARSAGL